MNKAIRDNVDSLYFGVLFFLAVSVIAATLSLVDLLSVTFNNPGNTLDHIPIVAMIEQSSLPDALTSYTIEAEKARVKVPFAPNQRWMLLYDRAVDLLLTIIVVIVFGIFRKIVSSLKAGLSFTPANAKRIRLLTTLIIYGLVLDIISPHIFSFFAFDLLAEKNLSVDLSEENNSAIAVIIISTVLGILSEVFRHGVRIQEEQALTV